MWPLGSSGMVPDCAISAPVELYNSYWYETAGCVLSTRSWISRPGLAVETRAPRNLYRLEPGQRCAVPPKTAHHVQGVEGGPCKFLIVQGVGVYDFIPVG